MKIYTKTGDGGTTGLFSGKRVAKHDIRINSYGTIDELNSWLGLIRDQQMDAEYRKVLIAIQQTLFTIGAILATEVEDTSGPSKRASRKIPEIRESDIVLLENEIDRMDDTLPPMTHFILPGGHQTVSYCHIARTVCRRAERHISQLHQASPINELVLVYTNRLSDYLFVLARKLSYDLGTDEIKWIPASKT